MNIKKIIIFFHFAFFFFWSEWNGKLFSTEPFKTSCKKKSSVIPYTHHSIPPHPPTQPQTQSVQIYFVSFHHLDFYSTNLCICLHRSEVVCFQYSLKNVNASNQFLKPNCLCLELYEAVLHFSLFWRLVLLLLLSHFSHVQLCANP